MDTVCSPWNLYTYPPDYTASRQKNEILNRRKVLNQSIFCYSFSIFSSVQVYFSSFFFHFFFSFSSVFLLFNLDAVLLFILVPFFLSHSLLFDYFYILLLSSVLISLSYFFYTHMYRPIMLFLVLPWIHLFPFSFSSCPVICGAFRWQKLTQELLI
jgi:hypothetical protein